MNNHIMQCAVSKQPTLFLNDVGRLLLILLCQSNYHRPLKRLLQKLECFMFISCGCYAEMWKSWNFRRISCRCYINYTQSVRCIVWHHGVVHIHSCTGVCLSIIKLPAIHVAIVTFNYAHDNPLLLMIRLLLLPITEAQFYLKKRFHCRSEIRFFTALCTNMPKMHWEI